MPKLRLLMLSGLLLLVAIVGYRHMHAQQVVPKPKTTTFSQDKLPPGRTIFTQKGRGVALLDSFRAPARWDLYWNYICYGDYSRAGFGAIPQQLDEGAPEVKSVQTEGISGFGDQPYTSAGTFRLGIQAAADCTWQVTVKSP